MSVLNDTLTLIALVFIVIYQIGKASEYAGVICVEKRKCKAAGEPHYRVHCCW